MAKFFAGDVVRLKSGGPEMTVIGNVKIPVNTQPIRISNSFSKPSYQPTELKDTTKVTCTWFDGKELMTNNFEEATLEKVSKDVEK